MAGSVEGGKMAAATNMKRYDKEYLDRFGMTFYQYLGHLGGKNGHTGGFSIDDRNLLQKILHKPTRAQRAGKIGDAASRRGKSNG